MLFVFAALELSSFVIPLISIFGSLIVALQSWILLEILRLRVQTARFDQQISRLVSDAESEKETRKRLHEGFEFRLRAVEMGLAKLDRA